MIRLVVDEVVGLPDIFGDYREKYIRMGNLPYWLDINKIDYEIVSLKSSKEFIYIINCPCLSAEYENYDFSTLSDIDCKIIINDAMEGSSWLPREVENFTLYLKIHNINPERVTVITQNYNYADAKFPFNIVIWNLMESFARVNAIEWIDYNDDAKKFLCLNRWPHQHRIDFMSQMYKLDILDQFNYSMPDEPYDNVDMKPGLYWEFPYHKKESLLYIVTETFFDRGDYIRDVSEKTWRPIALQMPFILIHQPFALRRLRELGYRTFPWDESYDTIIDPKERMTAIIDLVVTLNSRNDFVELIESCRDIVEHNFDLLKIRRPEMDMIRALS
jgi:hypothetical protein